MMNDDRWQTLGRIALLAVAAALVCTAHAARGPEFAWRWSLVAIVALACVWFGESLASLAGLHHWRMHPPANGPTPGCFFAFAGRMLLVLPMLAFLWQ